jgi:hypothetical protein
MMKVWKLIVHKARILVAIALIGALLPGLCGCLPKLPGKPAASDNTTASETKPEAASADKDAAEGAVAESEPVSVKREPDPPALETANEAAALALSQYIYARVKTEDFITADLSTMKPEEIAAMVDELAGLWDTSQQLTTGAEGIADTALLVLQAPAAGQTAASGVGLRAVPLAASDAQKWAESLTAQYDAIKGGQTLKQLAKQLGTDARTAFEQLKLAQDIIKSGADADADFYDKLTKAAMATKTACKVGLFVAGTVATGGGSLTALAGSSMTLTQAGAAIISGTDAIVDVATTGSTIILGDNHQCTTAMTDLKGKLAPVTSIVGLVNFDASKVGKSIAYVGDRLTDLYYQGKVMGVKVFKNPVGTKIDAALFNTATVAAGEAAKLIEKMGFIPPEKQTVTRADVLGAHQISRDDALKALENLKGQMKDLAKAAGLLLGPPLDEVVGSYTNGMMTFTDVYISDALKAQAQSGGDGGSSQEGCDMNMLPILEALKGQAKPMTLVIAKTGADAGTLTLINRGEPKEGDLNVNDTPPIAFTYADGVLTFNVSTEGGLVAGKIEAAYSGKDVTLSGTLRLSDASQKDDLYIDIAIIGSKPPVV